MANTNWRIVFERKIGLRVFGAFFIRGAVLLLIIGGCTEFTSASIRVSDVSNSLDIQLVTRRLLIEQSFVYEYSEELGENSVFSYYRDYYDKLAIVVKVQHSAQSQFLHLIFSRVGSTFSDSELRRYRKLVEGIRSAFDQYDIQYDLKSNHRQLLMGSEK